MPQELARNTKNTTFIKWVFMLRVKVIKNMK